MTSMNNRYPLYILGCTIVFIAGIVVLTWVRSPTRSVFQDADAQDIVYDPQCINCGTPDPKPKTPDELAKEESDKIAKANWYLWSEVWRLLKWRWDFKIRKSWKPPEYPETTKIDPKKKYTHYMFVMGNGMCYQGLKHAEFGPMTEMDPYTTRITTMEGVQIDLDGGGRIGVYHNESQRVYLSSMLTKGDHTPCVTPPEKPTRAARSYDWN